MRILIPPSPSLRDMTATKRCSLRVDTAVWARQDMLYHAEWINTSRSSRGYTVCCWMLCMRDFACCPSMRTIRKGTACGLNGVPEGTCGDIRTTQSYGNMFWVIWHWPHNFGSSHWADQCSYAPTHTDTQRRWPTAAAAGTPQSYTARISRTRCTQIGLKAGLITKSWLLCLQHCLIALLHRSLQTLLCRCFRVTSSLLKY